MFEMASGGQELSELLDLGSKEIKPHHSPWVAYKLSGVPGNVPFNRSFGSRSLRNARRAKRLAASGSGSTKDPQAEEGRGSQASPSLANFRSLRLQP